MFIFQSYIVLVVCFMQVILLERDWNLLKNLQAMDHAHRIGQKKDCFCLSDSFEERLKKKS